MAKKSVKSQKVVVKSHFSKSEAISFGFELAKKNLFFFVVLYLIVILISAVMSGLRLVLLREPAFAFLFWIVQTVLDLIIGIGIIKIAIEFIDKKVPEYKDLFITSQSLITS